MIIRVNTSVALIALAVGLATPTYAAETAAAGAQTAQAQTAQRGGIEEIVVTARKREENLQQVPLAINAFGAEEISRRSIRDLGDVAAATPGVTFFENINSTLASPVIRGISQTVIAAPDRNVGLFYNGIFLSNTNASNFDLFEMERIEVVKGPQSALYGRNAFAGAINYVPKKASFDRVSGFVEGTIGTDEKYQARAGINVPLGSSLAARLSVGYDSFDGTIPNARTPGDNVNGNETKAISWDIQGKLTEAFTFSQFGFWTDDQRENGAVVFFPNNCGFISATDRRSSFYCGELPAFDKVGVDPRSTGSNRKGVITGGELNYDFGFATATFLAGYVNLKQTLYSDRDFTTDGLGSLYDITRGSFFAPTLRQARLPTFVGNGPDKTEDWNLEFRVESAQDQRFRWLAGVSRYIHYKDDSTTFKVDTTSLAPGEIPKGSIFLLAFPQAVGPVVAGQPLPKIADSYFQDLGNAAFVAADFDLTDALTLGAEVRWDQEQRKRFNKLTRDRQWREDKFWTFRFNADYKVTQDALVYASAAKGVIAGFFNGTVDAAAGNARVPLELQNYDPSTNWTYEIGAKTSWLDGRVTANVAAFYIKYKDLQIQSTPPAPLVTVLTLNTASANAKGFEAELNWRPIEPLTLTAGYGYTEPKYGKGTIDRGVDRYCGDRTLCTNQVGGSLLTRASKHTFSGSAQWEGSLTGDWTWFARADVRYQSKQFTRSINIQWIPGRTLVNARLGVSKGRDLEISIWGKNIFNKLYPTVAIAQPNFNDATSLFVTNTATADTRTLGITAKYNF
jgi:iron complex outermembrane receptor protein